MSHIRRIIAATSWPLETRAADAVMPVFPSNDEHGGQQCDGAHDVGENVASSFAQGGEMKPASSTRERIAFHRQVSLALFGRKFGDSVPLEKAATRFQRRNAPAKLHKGDKAK